MSRVSIGLVLLGSRPGLAGAAPLPVLSGYQHCQYRIAWNGTPAASATVDFSPDLLGDVVGYAVEARTATNAFVDLFRRFRGDASATVLAEGLTSLRFRFDRQVRSSSLDLVRTEPMLPPSPASPSS